MSKESSKWKQNIFFLGLLLSGIRIRIIGDVYLGEILLIVCAFDLLFSKTRVFQGKYWKTLPKLFFLWAVANAFSNLANQKNWIITATSVFTVILTFTSLYGMIGFVSKYHISIKTFSLLFVFGRLFGSIINQNANSETLLWKFGIGEWIILLTVLLLKFSHDSKFFLALLVFCSIFSFINQARTLGVLSALVIVFSLAKIRPKSSLSVVGLLLLIFLPLIYLLYIQIANLNLLGSQEHARAQVLTASEIGPLAARTEFIFSSKAFLQSPLYGLGFDPNVNSKIIYDGYNWLSQVGVPVGHQMPTSVPLHSFIMSAFVQGGILAGLYWAATLIYASRQLLNLAKYERNSRALLAYVSLSLINRVLFSPYGAYERLNSCFFLLIIFVLSRENEKSLNKNALIE